MKMTVRDLIVNAMAEARLVNRSQPIPGNLFVDAYSLFKKRFDQYSNTNYLSFIRKEINFKPMETSKSSKTVLGTYVLKDDYEDYFIFAKPSFTIEDLPEATMGMHAWDKDCTVGEVVNIDGKITWHITTYPNRKTAAGKVYEYFEYIPDIEVTNLQEVVRCYVRPFNSTNDNAWRELKFIAYEDFYDYGYSNEVYSVLPTDDAHVTIMLKEPYLNYEVKVIYNEAYEFGPDDELNIPRQFISLFTAALVYDLAIQFPRLSDTTVALLKGRLDELEENVRRSSSVNKFIGRDLDRCHYSYIDGLTGSFLGIE